MLLMRINEEGAKVPYEIWDAQRARTTALNLFEMNEICNIMDDIQNEAYHEFDCTYWLCDFEKIGENSRDKIIKYLMSLGYEVVFAARNDLNQQMYKIKWQED